MLLLSAGFIAIIYVSPYFSSHTLHTLSAVYSSYIYTVYSVYITLPPARERVLQQREESVDISWW
jgi:hypothetical protein